MSTTPSTETTSIPLVFDGVEVIDATGTTIPDTENQEPNPDETAEGKATDPKEPANESADDAPNPNKEPDEKPATWFQEAATVLGIQLEADATFEDNIDGITSLVKTASEKLAEAKVNEYFNSNPFVKEVSDFIRNGGDIKDFIKTTENNWSSLSLKEDDEVTQIKIITEALKASNLSDAVIDSFVKDAKEKKTLNDLAKDQLKVLQTKEQENKQALLAAQEEKQKLAEQQAIENYKHVTAIVEKGFIDNYILPKEKSKAFLDAFYGEGENSITHIYDKLSLEKKLAVALFIQNEAKPLPVKKATTPDNMFNRRSDKTSSSSNPTNTDQNGIVLSEVTYKS